ncbi:MAG: hypothetical protein O3A06_01650 [Proteobacteria bacterium]|nr:hypothetical protein [Pseudomonadota bacterium]MDA0981745.1 hypothetical protein [Pseudomonadota bacterium]
MNYLRAMQGLSICDLSDACDALGIVPATSGAIKAVHPGCAPVRPRGPGWGSSY